MTPTRDELKRLASEEIDRRGDELVQVSRSIGDRPEAGFRERRTAAAVSEWFRGFGIPYRDGLAVTGVKGELRGGGGDGPAVAVVGELDSLVVPDHPNADAQTGAAHACGHHAQIGMMLAATAGLLAPGVLPALSGRVVPFAVPAEEYIQIEYRHRLRERGELEFLTGKAELLRLGEFDDVDMALITHTSSRPEDGKLVLAGSCNGMVAKMVTFTGRSAHAGAVPWRGVNALNAASLAIQAVHAQRETFRDEDTVRIHPIITKAGDAVSAVPRRSGWRVSSAGGPWRPFRRCSEVRRAMRAGAMAIGAEARITTLPGYLPIENDRALEEAYRPNAEAAGGRRERDAGATPDALDRHGDLSAVMPVYHPNVRAAEGTGHGNDYVVTDWDLGVLTAAKAMAFTVIDLLADGAVGAKRVVSESRPAMTRGRVPVADAVVPGRGGVRTVTGRRRGYSVRKRQPGLELGVCNERRGCAEAGNRVGE